MSAVKSNVGGSFLSKFKRYQKGFEIIIFCVLCAVCLFLCYTFFIGESKNTDDVEVKSNIETQKELTDILSQIKGVGDVNILISYADEGTKVIAYETQTDADGDSYSTPIFAGGDVVILSEKTPTIVGVVVVATGANSITVRNDILNAVSVGLNIDKSIIQIYEKGQ